MDVILEKYLNTVDRHLKPIAASEKADIIKEIKSQMMEMEKSEGLPPKNIINRLGSPEVICNSFSWNIGTRLKILRHPRTYCWTYKINRLPISF